MAALADLRPTLQPSRSLGPLSNRVYFLLARVIGEARVKKGPLARWRIHGSLAFPGVTIDLVVHPEQRFLLTPQFESNVMLWLCHNVRPSDYCIDVGAHVGRMAALMARLVGPTGSVDAIEPLPANIALLRRNLSRNACGARYRVIEACSDANVGTISLYGGASSFQSSTVRGDRVLFDVPAVTIDGMAQARAVAVLKIDVEGAELRVLQGARVVLTRDRPRIIVELHPPNATGVPELLFGFGYLASHPNGSPFDANLLCEQSAETGRAPFHVSFLHPHPESPSRLSL